MDKTTDQLVTFADEFSDSMITPAARDAALRRIVDSIACVIGGYDNAPARVAVRVARAVSSTAPATIFGASATSSPDLAAFANTVMLRGQDWNDGMLAKGGGHASDMIPGLLAIGEITGSSGHDVLRAIVLSYEILGALGSAVATRQLGWDQGTFMGAATALGAGSLIGLDRDQLASAMSLALVSAIPMRVTRVGELSMWKGSATAAAVRNAVFAVQLVKEGMTGPGEPFHGKSGFFDQVSGPFDLMLPAQADGRLVCELTLQKRYPAEAHSQALIGILPKIHQWTQASEIESIDIETYWHAYDEIGSHPAKWEPVSRETADHSLPYLVAAGIIDGSITLKSFTPERIADRETRQLMHKISIRENPEFTADYRPPGLEIIGNPHQRITVKKHTGEVFTEDVTYFKGHALNPLTAADIDEKMAEICEGNVPDAVRDEIKDVWWGFDEAPDVRTVIASLAGFGAAFDGHDN